LKEVDVKQILILIHEVQKIKGKAMIGKNHIKGEKEK